MFDWSNEEYIEIPKPKVIPKLNLILPILPTSKAGQSDYNPGINAALEGFMEFFDKSGNYFKKPILASAQGASSLTYKFIKEVKGIKIDIAKNLSIDIFASEKDRHTEFINKKENTNIKTKQHKIKFGDWLAFDSFHIKNFLLMYFVGVFVLVVIILLNKCINQENGKIENLGDIYH